MRVKLGQAKFQQLTPRKNIFKLVVE